MMKPLTILSAFCASLFLAGPSTAEERIHRSAAVGFEIEIPPDWTVLRSLKLPEPEGSGRLEDPALNAALGAKPGPLVVFAQHPEPFAGFNPTFKVALNLQDHLKGHSADSILERMAAAFEKAAPDFALTQKVQAIQVSSLPAATVAFSHTVSGASGESTKVLTAMCLVLRGSYLFLITMSGPSADSEVHANFDTALASMRIDP